MDPDDLLQPGRNCWRIENASRFALLVDAAACFAAVRAALREARHSIFILSWDIDSRMQLVPEGANDGWPEPLGDFLHALVSAQPGLQAQLLNWDYTLLYAMEREWLPAYRLGWRTHKRLQFRLDGSHPVGAAHHQKVIVVDDALAFVGGLDLTSARWDTPEHRWQDPRRQRSDGEPYEPFHDVQAMVEGEVAAALGDLCRERWRRATGQRLPSAARAAASVGGGNAAPAAVSAAYWPADVTPDLVDLDVGIARTEPEFDGRPAVLEIAQWYADVIARARHSLVFENQYFTATRIADALVQRLAEPRGPEVLVVSPQKQSGWLEEATMGVMRSRMHRRLQQADGHGRYRLVCPTLPDDGEGTLNVHSKLCFADEDALTIGSANLSNRSLACDTECNLCIIADGPPAQRARVRRGLVALRARLLAEHLAVDPVDALQACRSYASLFSAIDSLSGSPRCLRPFEPLAQPELDALIPQQAPFDPARTNVTRSWPARMLPASGREPLPRRLLALLWFGLGALLSVVLLLGGLGIAMRKLLGPWAGQRIGAGRVPRTGRRIGQHVKRP